MVVGAYLSRLDAFHVVQPAVSKHWRKQYQ